METLRELFQNPLAAWGTEASNTFMLFTLLSFLFGWWFAWLIWGRMAGRRKRALKELEGKHNVLNTNYLGLSEKHDLREADLQKANLEIEDLNVRVADADAQRERMHAQMFALKDNNVKLKTDNETYLQKIDTLDGQLISLQTQNAQLNEEVEENQATLENLNVLQSSYDATKNRISAMEERIASLADINETLSKEKEAYASKITSLDSEVNALQQKNVELVKHIEQNTTAMNNFAELETTHDATRDRVAALEEKLSKLAEDNKSLRSELGTVKSDNNSLKTELGSMKANNFQQNTTPVMPVVTQTTTNNADTEKEDTVEENVKIVKTSSAKSVTEAKTALRNAFGTKMKKATAAEKDDLKKINGIGPFIESKLNSLDIYTYEQISQWDDDLINTVTDAIEFFPGRIERDDWVGQAKKLVSGESTGNKTVTGAATFASLSAIPKTTTPVSTIEENVKTNKEEEEEVNARLMGTPVEALSTDLTDLKIIEGIGPATERLLHNNGIKDWTTLAITPVSRLKKILASAGGRYSLSDPGTWPQQAHLANNGEWAKLKEYQEYLDGGKEPKNK